MRVFLLLALGVGLATCSPPLSRQKRSRVCYDGLECFSNQPPFDNADELLPQPPNHINTTFRLYTRTCTIPRVLHRSDPDPLCDFSTARPTKVIVHGFLQHGQVPWLPGLAAEFLKREPMNVITVDWGSGSGFPYSQAVANTRVVGAEIGRLLQHLVDTTGLSLDDVHIVGHSLGAHIAGYAGNHANGLARITGLDPAEPDYKDTDPAVHLDKTDANFVDVIHSDGSEFNYDSGFGWIKDVGHVDFYPNGGMNQPGCASRVLAGVFYAAYQQGLTDAAEELSCSHSRSIYLFNESINSNCAFYGHPCGSLADLDANTNNCIRCERGVCPQMGYNADQSRARGKFYLRTRSDKPFCGFTQHVEVEFSNMTQEAGDVIVELDGADHTSDSITISSQSTPFMPQARPNRLLIDHVHVDHVVQVRVTFNSAGTGRWWWSEDNSKPVTISKVTVTSAENGRRIHFCGGDRHVANGNTITLTHSSTDPNECMPRRRFPWSFARRSGHVQLNG